MPDEHAVLLDREGRSVLRFQRLLAHPPERVWSALLEREDLEAWHPTPFELDPRKGGTITFLASKGAPSMPDGQVLAIEAPRLLAYTWGADELWFMLAAHEQGCLLTLEHSFEDRFKAARDGAGWHLCLCSLGARLDGRPVAERTEGSDLPAGWEELNAGYQQRFGIAAEQATPVPPR
jgi:uncharacterized protein YndB with AHSA1/START domain